MTREAQLKTVWAASDLPAARRRELLGSALQDCAACSEEDVDELRDDELDAWLVSHGVEPPDPLATKLWFDDTRPPPLGWTLATTVAEGMLHLSGGHVVEAWIDHADGLELVDWMIRTAVWPREQPRAWRPTPEQLVPEGRQAIVRDRILAYWRTRADIEHAPRFTCWTEPGDDADELMGFWSAADAASAFAFGRWRLAGCPDATFVHVLESSGARRLFEVRGFEGTLAAVRVQTDEKRRAE